MYATVVDKADHLYRLEGGEYDDHEFEAFPDRYGSIFANKVSHDYIHTYVVRNTALSEVQLLKIS